MKSYKTCKSLKEKKNGQSFSLHISLDFYFFFWFFISLCFSNILASSIVLGVLCVPEFFGDQWIEYNIGHGQISSFRRKQLILLDAFDLILLFFTEISYLFYILLLLLPIFILFKALIYFFFWFKCFYSRLLKTKKWSFFFLAHLFGFLLFVGSSSHCVSLTSSHL